MGKNRDKNELEHLRGQNRELKSENRNLKRRLKRLEKREHLIPDDDLETDYEEYEAPSKKEKCQECGKGFLEEVEVANRLFKKCNNCSWRSKAIKL